MENKYNFNMFDFWVFTTTGCNCNCEYCKQSKLDKYEVMTEDNLKYILDECIKIYNDRIVRKFKINLSGGEPLLVFDMFKDITYYYKKKYPKIFHFTSVSNGTIITNEIIKWIKEVLDNHFCISIDDTTFSKPINGFSSSELQIENILRLKQEKIRVSALSVLNKQSSMLNLAKFAIENFIHWRILPVKPYYHTKEQVINILKPVLDLLSKHNKNADWFDFDGWDLWNKKRLAGCVCGKTFLGILSDLEVIPNNGEIILKLGKFNSDLSSFLNHSDNIKFLNYKKPKMCYDCEIKETCDGACKICHTNIEGLKARCDSLKELMKYVESLK
jgi:uncharacterized protein